VADNQPVTQNKNRMTPASTFSEYAARLRQFMAQNLPTPGPTSISAYSDERFNAWALELFALQYAHNPVYQRLCSASGISPGSVSHWTDIRPVPTSAFKEFELTSLPPEERTMVFHSSGTTARQPSRHFHSPESLALYEASLLHCFEANLLPDLASNTQVSGDSRLDLLILTPAPAQAPHSSLVHMFATVRQKFGSASSTFAGILDADGAWSLDFARVESALERSVRTGRPLFLFGTAFSFVQWLDSSRARSYELPEGSRVLETGGYKGRSRVIPKAALYTLLTQHLGIPSSRIIGEYGMSELSSQAYCSDQGDGSGSSQVFQFPPWARVRMISPETGLEVTEGEAGLIQVFDLANAWSVLAIQTEDIGVRRGNGFELLGRATAAEPRGCSLMTA
jgi:hypothetical protein